MRPQSLTSIALVPGPVADLGGVQARGRGAPVPSRAPGAGGQPGGVGVAGERGAKCLGMLGVQVSLVVGAVEAEPDRTLARVTFRSSMNSVCTFWATSVLRLVRSTGAPA